MASLHIKNIHKSYGETQILRNINIDAEDGEFLVLLGPSGCGKSTLLSAIAGLDDVTSGEIVLDKQVINNLAPDRRDIAMVFQSYALYPTMSVRENLTFGMRVRGESKTKQDAAVKEVAAILQLSELLKRNPGQLSGGQRQRVAIGRAMVRSPKIFLFDEPLSNLDAMLRTEMRAELKKLHQRLKVTTVYVTHDQIEAMTLATKIVVMNKGRVQQMAAPQEIYERPANVFVATFIGSPKMNCLRGRITGSDGGYTFVGMADARHPLKIRLPQISPRLIKYIEQEIIFAFRPEWITLTSHPTLTTGQLSAVVDVVEPTGADNFVIFNANQEVITARLDPNCGEPGQALMLSIDMAKALYFDCQTEMRIA
ncbi:MAG: carbohydrate transporter ATP-binding protein family [Rhodoferax sp.]|nr:carbohydrate transporter ATP-binding protein family [Rhodoferax sp.]